MHSLSSSLPNTSLGCCLRGDTFEVGGVLEVGGASVAAAAAVFCSRLPREVGMSGTEGGGGTG